MKKIVFTLTSLLTASALTMPQAWAETKATDVFANYAQLSSYYKLGTHYTIEKQSKTDDVMVLAIHGGKIEEGTDQIAKAVAKDDHSYYIFKSLISKDDNKDGRNDLHLTSTHFDEPTALKMTASEHKVVSIHGAAGDDKIVYMGGLNKNLKTKIEDRLKAAGFNVQPPPKDKGLGGESQDNIANKGRNLQGAQLELTRGLRDMLVADSTKMTAFANAVRDAITASSSYPDGQTIDFGSDSFTRSFWVNNGNTVSLPADDVMVIKGVQSPIDNTKDETIRMDIYDNSGAIVATQSTQAIGHKWFISKSGLKKGDYKIKITNVSGNPSWIYGGLSY